MLMIYHSNHLDTLKTLMESIVERERLDNAFEPEIILVQNTTMTKRLKISLSQKFGIAANIEFLLPASFIWKMFLCVLPDVSQNNVFSKQSMSWKLMTLVPEMLKHEEFLTLQQYLTGDINKRKLFQFASRTACLYEKYMTYRPTWLTAWESGLLIEGLPEAQVWQAYLWRNLVALTEKFGQPQWHYANLYDRFIFSLKSVDSPPSNLPSRVFIYGISALPPVYLEVLNALAKYMDIHILFINPCRYWGNIQSTHSLENLVTRQRRRFFEKGFVPLFKDNNTDKLFDKEEIQSLPNPLLASWGKIGRDYIHMLSNISSSKNSEIDAFLEITPDSLLHNIQLDILELENRTVDGITASECVRSDMKRRLDPNDRSLTVHICHSQQREVEVLHDRLLTMLQDDHSLTPYDIVVLVTNIDSYRPFIKAVFDSATGDCYIPYSISGCRDRKFHSVIQLVISLLSLHESRFTSKDVLALLEAPIIAARFDIDEKNLHYLRQWINESGVRWGLNDENIKDFDLPVTGQHTWKFGLTRMLLGYAMDSNEGEWKGVLPYDESSGSIAELIGRLGSFLTQLNRWRRKIKQPRPLKKWSSLCREVLNDFFLPDNDIEEAAIALIEQQWQDIISEGITSHYDDTIPLSLLRDELRKRLEQEASNHRFLIGAVNICAMMPMCSTPFRVVCLLGMNDSVYPRMFTPLSFDLMEQELKQGDPSDRDNDRYLFLELLISTQQTIYISYIGRSIQDNTERFPSVLVQELIDYIGKSHYLPGDEKCNFDESERHVKAHITFHHSRMPFDPINYENNERQSYVRVWLPAAKREGTAQASFIQTLRPLPINVLKFEQLQHFWSHPIRAFFQQRLRVYFGSEENDIPDTEPFTIEGLNRYHLNKELLDTLIEKKDVEILFRRYRAAGKLPYGNFGEIVWEAQYQEMKALARRVIECLQPSQNIEINLNCNGVQLTGLLQNVQADGLLRRDPAMLSISQALQLWLEHLVYSASGNKGESRLFTRKDGEWRFPPIAVRTAQDYLNLFVEGYLKGMKEPLLLLLESGGAWIKSRYDAKNDVMLTDEVSLQKARKKFFQIYKGNTVLRGESEDIWYKRLWYPLDLKYFNTITEEAERYLLLLFKFKQP